VKLLIKLVDDGVENKIVRVLSVWYSKQSCYVKWQNVVSREFSMSNGTRQDGILSPYLFSRYIRELLVAVDSTAVGCFIGNRCLCLVIARPSVCRLSVTFVHPTQAIEIVGNVSTPFGMLVIYDNPATQAAALAAKSTVTTSLS